MSKVYLKDGKLFANDFVRVVHGERGDYVEFKRDQIVPKLISYFDNESIVRDVYYYYMTPVYDLRVIEDKDFGYTSRTDRNASADVTLAIALDYNTSGEVLTKKVVERRKKLYIAVEGETIESMCEKIINLNKKDITLNIAGNGIYTLKKYSTTQDHMDFVVLNIVKVLVECLKENGINISLIRSGGQTGVDESGIKAALSLGIPALIVCPKGYRMRTLEGDFFDKEKFLSRFNKVDLPVKVYKQVNTVKYADYKIGMYYVSVRDFKDFKDPEMLF